MLCRLFDDRKYTFLDIVNHQEYCYLGKQKFVCIFLHQIVNTGDLHLVKCAILAHYQYKMPLIGQFISLLNLKIIFLQI